MQLIESFSTLPLQTVIPSYLYMEYADDDDLQAFVNSFNSLSQGYLDWFLQTPLGVYTLSTINGTLLDWVGLGLYGIPRPVLSSEQTFVTAGYNSFSYDTLPLDGSSTSTTGTATIASDDIYKRVLTWHVYRGDGQVFNMQWLKNRIARFLLGANGSAPDVLSVPPSITVSGNTFTIAYENSDALMALEQLINNDELALPFQYNFVVGALILINNGHLVQISPSGGYPTTNTGLPAGAIWSDGGVVAVIPGYTYSGAVLMFAGLTADVLESSGADLPFTNPSNPGQLWNNGGVVSISY